jgi:hypothetical protein
VPLVFHPRFARKKRVLPLAEVLASFLMNVARDSNHELVMFLAVFGWPVAYTKRRGRE